MSEGDPENLVGRLRELHHAATNLMAATDVESVYATAVETANSVLGFDFCTVFVPHDEGYEAVASSHFPVGSVVAIEDGVLPRTFARGESSIAHDLRREPDASPTNEEYRSGVSVPIGEGAVLQAVSRTPGTYDQTDLELAELLALHAEAALDSIRSRETITERTRRLARLHDITTEISACGTQDELFDLMREASEGILGFDWCSLYVMEDGRFVAVMTSDASPVAVGEYPFPDGRGKAHEVFETGESIRADDVTALPGARPTSDRMRAAMTIPVGDLGVFNAAHESPGTFDDHDLELAEILANSVAEAHARIEAENQLRDRTRDLERQNARLDRFASTVSHDIRNPLNVAMGFTELAAESGDPEAFERIRAAHDRIETMIEELLLLTRDDRPLERVSAVPVAAHVREAWTRVESPDATLTVTLPEEYTVRAHPGLLSHVLENLLQNAIAHNEPPITVTVEPIEDGRGIAGFAVADDGDGIPPDLRNEVFEHGYSTETGGTGYGLAIVEEFVEAHGWEISVAESPTGGVSFEVTVDR